MSDDDVRFEIHVKITCGGKEDFKIRFEFSGDDPEAGVLVRYPDNLSEADEERLANLAGNFGIKLTDISCPKVALAMAKP
jgi:hypothetical protein